MMRSSINVLLPSKNVNPTEARKRTERRCRRRRLSKPLIRRREGHVEVAVEVETELCAWPSAASRSSPYLATRAPRSGRADLASEQRGVIQIRLVLSGRQETSPRRAVATSSGDRGLSEPGFGRSGSRTEPQASGRQGRVKAKQRSDASSASLNRVPRSACRRDSSVSDEVVSVRVAADVTA